MKEKLENAGGLTLVEMLCAVAILVLLCLLMNTGMQMAAKSYDRLTAESETQLLFGSLSDALIDKLRYCVVTEKPDPAGGASKYEYSIGTFDVSGSGMVLVGGDRLLPDGAYGTGRWEYRVECIEKDGNKLPLVRYEGGNFIVNFKVIWKKDKGVSAQTPEGGLVVRCLNPVRRVNSPFQPAPSPPPPRIPRSIGG